MPNLLPTKLPSHDSVPLHVLFRSGQYDCLLLEETVMLNFGKGVPEMSIYRSYKGAWWFWRCATPEEVADILAATGED
jgi:hypothetical protein